MLRIKATHYTQIRRHAEDAYPHECCGILMGKFEAGDRTVDSIVPSANAADTAQQTTYVIDPRELIRARREARGRGLEIVGFYHSHPDHPARPSATDLEHAHWIGCSYLITSASASGAGQTKSFLLAGKLEEDKHFVEEQIVTQADCAQND